MRKATKLVCWFNRIHNYCRTDLLKEKLPLKINSAARGYMCLSSGLNLRLYYDLHGKSWKADSILPDLMEFQW